jgi:hypothetical protein
MKKLLNLFVFALILSGFMAIAQISLAQAPPPPPADKGTNSNKAPSGGGGAPIDGGLVISLAMVAGYGARKWWNIRSKRST